MAGFAPSGLSPTTLAPAARRLITAASAGPRQVPGCGSVRQMSGCGSVRRWRLKPPSTARHRQRTCPRSPAGRRRGKGDAANATGHSRGGRHPRRHAIMDTQARPVTGWPTPGRAFRLGGGAPSYACRVALARFALEALCLQGCRSLQPSGTTGAVTGKCRALR